MTTIDRDRALPITRQADLLQISRGSVYIPMRQGFLYLFAVLDWAAYQSISKAKAGIGNCIPLSGGVRPHSSLDGRTPDTLYSTSVADVAA